MDIISVISVFVASVVELWLAIPLGLFLKMNPVIIAVSAACGSIFSAFLVVTLGEGVRKWFLKWRYGKKSSEEHRINDIWKKYGVIGLGMLSPLLFGAPLGAALGIAVGAPKNSLLLWMTVGIIVWSIILTSAGYLGIISFESIS
jgi:membrane protein YqaA with SNARE-associated domain